MFRRSLTALIAVSILLSSPVLTLQANSRPLTRNAPAATAPGVLFRTTVTLRQPTDRARLDQLGVLVLSETTDHTVVLVDADQLETLARLRFEPSVSDEVVLLVVRSASSKPWLATSLQPLLTQARLTAVALSKANGPARTDILAPLHAMLQALSPEQRADLNALSSIDDDGDGMTNTEEQWWCTDPEDPNTRGDMLHTDKDYVVRLKQYLWHPELGDHRLGQPFQGWPPQTTNFNYPDRAFACPDVDGDSVPDGTERVLGLNPNNPHTAHDRYNDGVKLFGLDKTGATLPPTVRDPGKHPFVAAYPVIHVDAVPNTFHVETVTELHLDTTVMTGTAKTYGTADTRGASDSVADTQTWNDWQEVSHSTVSAAKIIALGIFI